MVKQGASNDEVVGTLFYYIPKDIDAADLKTRHLQVYDISEIDVARDHVTSGRYALNQSLRDRSVATAEFLASPAWTHSKPHKASALDGIQQRGH
jgi:hypothetical protein